MGFSARMAAAAPRLSLVQVPGAGLIASIVRHWGPGMRLVTAYGHETGIAEYVMGAMIALTRSFGRLDARLRQGRWESQWAVGTAAPRCGPSWRARHSASWALVTSERRSPAAPRPST